LSSSTERSIVHQLLLSFIHSSLRCAQMHQIRGCTLGNGGHAAFASIMWSPPLVSVSRTENDDENVNGQRGDFYDCLKNVSCDVLLVFGKDDPWCKPAFAKRMLLALEEREGIQHNKDSSSPFHHRYVEISNSGHCPNHECPRAVGYLVNQWVDCKETDRSKASLSLAAATPHQEPLSFAEEWGEMTVRERNRHDIQVGWKDKIVTSMM
jgi:pimeloyl-ACP methyl ester carboxylesterase